MGIRFCRHCAGDRGALLAEGAAAAGGGFHPHVLATCAAGESAARAFSEAAAMAFLAAALANFRAGPAGAFAADARSRGARGFFDGADPRYTRADAGAGTRRSI